MNDACIFCLIAQGEIPSNIVFQNDEITVFEDQHPKDAVHLLVIPNAHYDTLEDVPPVALPKVLGSMHQGVRHVAKMVGFDSHGYHTRIHVGAKGGQEVMHLHMHIRSDFQADLKST